MNTFNFPSQVAWRTLNMLINKKALVRTSGVAFYVWQRDDRIIVAFDPTAIVQARVNDDFAHELSTILRGRRVARTNSRGIFLQVALDVPPAPRMISDGTPLDLSQQPTAWHLPVGMTQDGPLWIPLFDAVSFLIGGTRGGGKTGEEHAWIQALLHGNKTIVYAWDGKRGVEFGRYIGHPNFNIIFNDVVGIQSLQTVMKTREKLLAMSGYQDIITHNAKTGSDQFIPPIALFVDEAADLDPQTKNTLNSMIRLYRHVGLYPIIATNQPTVADTFPKTNLLTRIAFKVPHHNDSVTMLGYKGAEALPDIRGRGLIVWKGNFVEFQSFVVIYPETSHDAIQQMSEQFETSAGAPVVVDEIASLAESIRSDWTPDLSGRAVGRLLGKAYGGAWKTKIDKIVAFLSATTTPTPPVLSPDGAGQ